MPGLADIVKLTHGTQRPGDMLPRSLSMLISQGEAKCGALYLLDLKQGEYALASSQNLTSAYSPVLVANQLSPLYDSSIPLRVNYENSPLAFVAFNNRAIRSSDLEGNLDWASLGVEEDLNAILVPILRLSTCLGAVLIARERPFSDRDLASLAASAQAVAAIYDLRTQFRLLGQMQAPLDLRQPDRAFFESVVSLLIKSSGMEFIALRRLEPDGTLSLLRGEGIVEDAADIAPDSLLGAKFSEAIETKEAVSVDSVTVEGLGGDVAGFAPMVESFVIAPIVLGKSPGQQPGTDVDALPAQDLESRVFGTLSLAARVEYEYSPLERLGFMTLANGIGLAIENYWNVAAVNSLRERQIEAGAALQAQEMAQGFRHEIRKKIDNVNGVFAVDASIDEIEQMVHKQTTSILDVLDEWKNYPGGSEYAWKWVGLGKLWADAVERAEFQLGEAGVDVRDHGALPMDLEFYCSPEHFVRFVLDGLILNSVDAFRERRSRRNREIGLRYVGKSGDWTVLRYHDTAGGLRTDRVRARQKANSVWSDMPANQLVFEEGFTTKAETGTGVGGGYGLYLARSTMTQHNGEISLVKTGEPGAVFDIRLAPHHVRKRR